MTVDVSAAPVWRTLRTDGWSPASGRRVWYASMTGRADSVFLKHRYEKHNEVQRACAGARRRHGRAPRGRVLCDTIFTALRAESSSRPESTTIVRRSSRNFAARRTTSTASAGASLASATTTASRGLFRTSIRRSRVRIAGNSPACAGVGGCASNVVPIYIGFGPP